MFTFMWYDVLMILMSRLDVFGCRLLAVDLCFCLYVPKGLISAFYLPSVPSFPLSILGRNALRLSIVIVRLDAG